MSMGAFGTGMSCFTTATRGRRGGRIADARRTAGFRCNFAFPRRNAPGLCMVHSPERGRGERRMPVAPAASCALCIGKKHTSKRVPRNHPAFPHAMVLTVYFVLSPVTGLFCHRRQRIKVLSAPGRADSTSANLTPASGRQDHTTSPYASAPFVSSPFDRSRIPWRTRPASRCAPDTAASTASLPASVTIAIRPSVGRDGANL
jgi:hypothetical protein